MLVLTIEILTTVKTNYGLNYRLIGLLNGLIIMAITKSLSPRVIKRILLFLIVIFLNKYIRNNEEFSFLSVAKEFLAP